MKIKENSIDFENSIGPWLGRTMKMLDYHMLETFQNAGLDLTKEQMVILKKLHFEDGLNQNELAFLTYRNKSSLARLLLKMENKSYIIRKQNIEDKRINEVYLTEVGRSVYKKTRPVIKEMINTMEAGISEKEKQQIINTLKKVQKNFESF